MFQRLTYLFDQLKGKNKSTTRELELLSAKFPLCHISEDAFVISHRFIDLGPKTKINRGVQLIAYGKNEFFTEGKITVGENCLISNDTKLFAGRGKIVIGNNAEVGMNCFISAQRRVLSRAENSEEHAMEVFDTIIGDECLMGSGVIIVEGSEIGKGCVIAAGAVISGIYGDNLFFAGNPARAIPKKNMNG